MFVICCHNTSSLWYHQGLEGPYLAHQSLSLWINTDGFCGLGCHLQCAGAAGYVITTCASCTIAPTLGPVPHVWGRWVVGLLRNWVFLNLPVWAWLRGKRVSDVQVQECYITSLTLTQMSSSLSHCGPWSQPCSEPSAVGNQGKNLYQCSYTAFRV